MRIAITGGTGSLGQALTRHFLSVAERVVVFSRDELKQAVMSQALVADAEFGKGTVRFFLGDVRDRRRMVDAFAGCDVVIHAAALKRVDAVASHMGEIMKTNGPDSLVGLIVSTIQGSTETTFYVLALYYGVVQIRRVRHTLVACLVSEAAGVLGSVWAVRLMV